MELADNEELDVNYNYMERIPIFSAINNKMYKLFDKIVNHPKWDCTIEDGFGETLFESLIYFYASEEISKSEQEEIKLKKMIISLINSDKIDFEIKDLNQDTAINIACAFPKAIWIVEVLLKKGVDVNVKNDFNRKALEEAISYQNIEAIKLLAKYGKSEVTDFTVKMAKEYNINLSEFGF